MNRLLLTAAVAASAAAMAPAAANAAGGALSVSPAIVEHTAARGATTPVTVVNSTNAPLKITVTPRPWAQSRSTGAVVPDRHRTLLSRLKVSARTFTLAPGGRRTVTVTVRSVPKSGSIYGAVETVGLPTGKAKKRGITAAYRLIGSLRLNPAASRRHLTVHASSLRRKGSALRLPVKNTGNTIGAVTGDVRITGARGTRAATVRATSIVPGATVDLPLGSTTGLPKGTYTVSVVLVKQGRTVLRSKRTLRVR
ncbi:hypothetical protein AB0L40_01785 [Patulibacter sp. NPDC049589]|uniref:hypothetical protein n=1 Tax=Patulibacter sp. NPDC049589 TaxID=3154731 RepID=UPI003419A5ED